MVDADPSQNGEDLGRGALAGADGAVDGAVGDGRGLGAGPVDPAERFAEEVAARREDARRAGPEAGPA